MKADKKNLIAMLRRRLVSLRKTEEREEEQKLLKEITELLEMLKVAID